jgi:hypothetical protein
MTQENIIICQANSTLTTEQLTVLSEVFPKRHRPRLANIKSSVRSGGKGFLKHEGDTVVYNMDVLTQRLTPFDISKLNEALERGVCLQALAMTNLAIPMSDAPIILRA